MSDLHDWLRSNRFFKRRKVEATPWRRESVMDDLVTRLRNVLVYGASLEGVVVPMGVNSIAVEAADEIVRLRAALAEAEAQVAELNKGESREWVRSSLLDDLDAERFSLKAALAEAKAERDRIRPAIVRALSSLAAAISLLEHSEKSAAPSDRMFDLMLDDYRRALANARDALTLPTKSEEKE